MSLSLSTISTFERLPDEVLLVICRYLSSIDILSAFYGLNIRLSQTISGYCQYVSLSQVSYKQLRYTCSSILPKIGLNIHSLIVSDEWQGLLSEVFLEHFDECMSSTFPHLKRLTLIAFTPTSLKLFLNGLINLPELSELEICLLSDKFTDQNESWMLMHQLFTINENRLTSILFDGDSTPFSCEINDAHTCYPNIKKLTIKLNTLHDFHNLLTKLPQIHFLDVTINKIDLAFIEDHQLLPACELKEFFFRSMNFSWDFNALKTILNRIPNVENLSIRILTQYDSRLVVGHEFFSQLSTLPLKIFNYILFYLDCSIDQTTIISTWQQFRQEMICVENDNKFGCVLYTLPFTTPQLTVFYPLISVVGNSDLIKSCGETIKSLCLYKFPPHIAETYIILTKCRRIKHLTIEIDNYIESKSDRKINPCKLLCLTSLILLNTSSMESKDFSALIETSPNLYQLTIYFTTLQSLFDDDFVCQLLRQRITHLKIILNSSSIELNTFPMARLALIFPQLKYLCFENQYFSFETFESLILAAFNHLSKWTSLISLTGLDMHLMEETCAKGIHQWTLEHISTYDRNSFLTDYTDYSFRLWF